jgi:LemA protein
MWISLIILVVLAAAAAGIYNSLVSSRNRVEEAWSDIEVQLKRRYDLIPNLVNTVKGYAKQESAVFENVTKARALAMGAGNNMQERLKDENMLTGALKSLFAVAESYPELKSNQNFMQMQNDLTDTEDKIQAARRFYNTTVRDFNTKLQTFPTNLFGQMLGFTAKAFFDIDEKGVEGQAVKVDF